jgi:hypothetical protein
MLNPALKSACLARAFAFFALAAVPGAFAQATAPESPAKAADAIARIRDEGLNHSEVMQTLSYLTEVIGPRLTGSPNLKRANEWTRSKFASWGLADAHLEAWGPFGRGWSLKRYSAQIVEPQAIPLIGCPNAWSPGLSDHWWRTWSSSMSEPTPIWRNTRASCPGRLCWPARCGKSSRASTRWPSACRRPIS